MTIPTDSLTPLLLVSELRDRINAKTATDVNNRMLKALIRASSTFQGGCRRRFDEYTETRDYTPMHISVGGDLFGLRELALDADLKAFTSIINGDGSPINPGNVKLLPVNSAYKSTVRLNPYGVQFWYHAGVTDPVGSIHITGTWGYGGSWVDTGATLNGAITAAATTLVSSAALEAGMVLKIDTEYLYVSAVSGTGNLTATVSRAFNADTNTAAIHADHAPITRWQSFPVVQDLITRFVQWKFEQDKSPLFGQQVMGDVTFPVAVDSWPKDIIDTCRTTRLIRPPRIQAV